MPAEDDRGVRDDTQQELLTRLAALERIAADYARLERLIEHMVQGKPLDGLSGLSVLYVDPQTLRISHASDSACLLLGYDAADLIGQSIAAIEQVDASSQPDAHRYIENGEEILVYPDQFRHRDGRAIPVRVLRRMLNKPDGQVVCYQIEDRSLAGLLWNELQRRENDEFLFVARLKTLNEVTLTLNRIEAFDDLCRAIVQAGIEQLGFDRMGMWFLDADRGVMTGSFGTDETGRLRDERGQTWSYRDTYIEDYLVGKVDAAFTIYDAPLFNERRQIIDHGWHIAAPMLEGERFIGVLTADNYLRKQTMRHFEPELLRLYGIVAGHLTALARARERIFTSRMERARTKIISQFIATVGHDFRNPLAIINTKAYLLRRSEAPEQRRTLMENIQAQVSHISAMLNNMLEFVAMESDLKLQIEPVNVRELVQESEAEHQVLRQQKALVFELEAVELPPILADRVYLRRAVSELILNAYEYTAAAGRISVSFPQYQAEIGIRVQDSGVGITADLIEHIFEPLYRINKARTEQRTGLGLAIVRMIVEAHRGRISVISEPGVGSTFEIILPSG